MVFLVASAVMVVLIILSYLLDRRYPDQRKIIIPTIFLLLLSVAGTAFVLAPLKPIILSDEEKRSIQEQQPKFVAWYGDYQKNIHMINQFTNSYQRIIQGYLDQQISVAKAKEELEELYVDTNYFTKKMEDWQPPQGLKAENSLIVEDLIKGTKVYQYHINEAIRQSISVLQIGMEKGLSHQETSNNLNRIRAIEYPVLLDNAQDIYEIKNNLKIVENNQQEENKKSN